MSTAAAYAEKPHILVIDDDQRLRHLLNSFLTDQGFIVAVAENAASAQTILQHMHFDVLVMDVMMPGQDGMQLTQSLRQAHNDVPILLLTARAETDDKIAGFESGADDYLLKPFEPRELVLRLQAILKRRPPPRIAANAPILIGPWQLPHDMNELRDDDGLVVKLTDLEAKLLRTLAQKPGEAFRREELTELMGLDAQSRTIDVLVTRLRRKIESDATNPRLLQTARGAGYLLRAGAQAK